MGQKKKIKILSVLTDNYLILQIFTFLRPKEKLEFSLTCKKINEIGCADMFNYLKKNYSICNICKNYPNFKSGHMVRCNECHEHFCIMKMNICRTCYGISANHEIGRIGNFVLNLRDLAKEKLSQNLLEKSGFFSILDEGLFRIVGTCEKCADGRFKNYKCKKCK